MAVFEAANNIRKWLNLIAPPVSLLLAVLYAFVIYPSIGTTGIFGFFTTFARMFGGSAIDSYAITGLIISIVGFVLYYIPKLGPFAGIKAETVHIWPEHIMTLVCGILLGWGSWWGGTLMWILWIFVWFLADNPIWDAAKD